MTIKSLCILTACVLAAADVFPGIGPEVGIKDVSKDGSEIPNALTVGNRFRTKPMFAGLGPQLSSREFRSCKSDSECKSDETCNKKKGPALRLSHGECEKKKHELKHKLTQRPMGLGPRLNPPTEPEVPKTQGPKVHEMKYKLTQRPMGLGPRLNPPTEPQHRLPRAPKTHGPIGLGPLDRPQNLHKMEPLRSKTHGPLGLGPLDRPEILHKSLKSEPQHPKTHGPIGLGPLDRPQVVQKMEAPKTHGHMGLGPLDRPQNLHKEEAEMVV